MKEPNPYLENSNTEAKMALDPTTNSPCQWIYFPSCHVQYSYYAIYPKYTTSFT